MNRHNDPEDYNPRQDRKDSLELDWNGKGIKAKGPLVIIILLAMAIVASNLYIGNRIEQTIGNTRIFNAAEHQGLKLSQDRTSCLLSLQPAERVEFRLGYQKGAFAKWCPWMEE